MENNNRSNTKSDHKKESQAVVNVVLTTSFSNEEKYFKELIATIKQNDSILLNDIIDELMHRTSLDNCSISYYDNDLNTFVYCGLLPLTSNVYVPLDLNTSTTPVLKLRARPIIRKDTLMRMELVEEDTENIEESSENNFISVRSKRAKERKIGLIIQKVYMWRKLYNGFVDDKGNLIRLTLEEAAEKVGISKKSLDDYLIQLR